MAYRVWKWVYLQVFGRSSQLSQNKFFDPSTPSIRKGDDEGEKKGKITVKVVATNVIASRPPIGNRLQRRPLVQIYKWDFMS